MVDGMEDFLDRLKTALAGQYEIERKLGAGGMAIVFLAYDPKHERKVAIKVMRPELAAALGSERFLREIKTAAKISHPNVLPVFDSGEADGFIYYVMPFVDGESLADLMSREQQLSIDDAVRIARETAEALSVAHSHGLVHRDIKPENIMLSGSHAIVADFGIARAVDQAGGEKLTETGMAVGTPAYMSPEQAASGKVDGRSDIYSLGCVLYEMLVGQVPFTGPTPMAIIARHTMDHVTPPHIMRDTIPQELEDIVLCAMAKTPADRFRTAQELTEALAAFESGAVPRVRRSTAQTAGIGRAGQRKKPPVGLFVGIAVAVPAIALLAWQLVGNESIAEVGSNGLDRRNVAVLYFADLSPDRQLAYVADALTESLIEKLSQVRELRVVSRNGAAQFRNAEIGLDSIARALSVGTLVTGSVEETGTDVRVFTRLVDGTNGDVIQRAVFSVAAEDLFALRDSVAESVSGLLQRSLGDEIELRERQTSTTSVEAWGWVQRGERLRKDALDLAEHDSMERAFVTLQQADSVLELAGAADPAWSEPLLLRGEVAYQQSRLTHEPHERWLRIDVGLQHAERALAVAPGNADALAFRGWLRYWYWLQDAISDPAERDSLLARAQADLEAAVRLDHTLASAHYALSHLHYQRKDVFTAMLHARSAYEQDAYLSMADQILDRLFWSHYDLAQFREAERWCNVGARRFPTDYRFVDCHLWMMITVRSEPDIKRAWQLLAELQTLHPPGQRLAELTRRKSRMMVGGVIARAGLSDSASNLLIAARTTDHEIDPEQELLAIEAAMRILGGDTDNAMGLLKRYVAANPGHSFESGGELHWWWRDLRDHPDFLSLTAPR